MNNATDKIDMFLSDNNIETWQHDNLIMFRKLIHEVVPIVEEDLKWGVPVFLVNGKLLCAMSTFKAHTKFNFFQGASLADKHHLFNSGLDSKDHRSINLAEGETIQEAELKDLIHEAVTTTKP